MRRAKGAYRSIWRRCTVVIGRSRAGLESLEMGQLGGWRVGGEELATAQPPWAGAALGLDSPASRPRRSASSRGERFAQPWPAPARNESVASLLEPPTPRFPMKTLVLLAVVSMAALPFDRSQAVAGDSDSPRINMKCCDPPV